MVTKAEYIEAVGVAMPDDTPTALYQEAKSFIEQYLSPGMTLAVLMQKLEQHRVMVTNAPSEDEALALLPEGLTLKNFWYQFRESDSEDFVALLQCIVRTPEVH